ncbi:MAG: hypothetical protein ACRDD8_16390 [Bacteroidales bacterium]
MKKVIMMFLMVGTIAMGNFTPDKSLIEMEDNALERLKKAEKELMLALKTDDKIAINIAINKVEVELNRFEIASKICSQEIYRNRSKNINTPEVIKETKGE